MLRNSRGQEYPNQDAKAQHAHRRDNPRLDSPPYRGCSSKLADGPLIAHNRGGLQDHRSFGSGNPQISYGSVYQYWRRTPEHPSFPGKEHNLVPSTGHYPDDPIFAFGYGKRPPGHPGNDLGLPRFNDSGRLIPASGDERARKSGGFFSRDAQKLDKLSRPSATPALAGPSTSSRRGFAQVPRTRPHDPIPAPSKSAADWAVQVYKGILRSHPKFVKDFEKKFYAWQRVWHSPKLGAVSR